MANNFTTPFRDDIMNYWFRNNPGSLTPPATVFASLHTGDPGRTGAATSEVSTSGTAYARTAATFGAPADASGFETVANTGAVTFPTATGSGFGTVTHTGMCRAGTAAASNLMVSVALTASKVVGAGDTFSFPIGSLTAGIN